MPISRYRISPRSFPESLPAIEYAPDVNVRRASTRGVIKFASCSIRMGHAFAGEPIGVRATSETDVYEVFYGHQAVGQFNLNGSTRDGRKTQAMSRLPRVAND